MSWNRLYRPTTVAQLHLESVRSQLQKMMKAGYIPQVLLFAGPKGTGKTSASRIIAALLNDPINSKAVQAAYLQKSEKTSRSIAFSEPTSETPLLKQIFAGTSYVVNEMDAASNRGIDDIRALKERVMLPPQHGNMSVYILDEAHMLTTDACNALLKLLEEPPSHVVFILATTELHKIPETIVSRCQVIQFHQATSAELLSALSNVMAAQKVSASQEALEAIAAYAAGSFRDAIKLLEMVSQLNGSISKEGVEAVIGSSIQKHIVDLLEAVIHRDESVVVQIFEQLRSQNVEQALFHKSLLQFLHTELLKSLQLVDGEPLFAKKIIQFLLQELVDPSIYGQSPIAHLPLELKVLSLIDRSRRNQKKDSPTEHSKPLPSLAQIKTSTPVEQVASLDELLINSLHTSAHSNKEEQVIKTGEGRGDGALLCQKWPSIIESVATRNSGIAALLRSAKPLSGTTGQATISVFYTFHQEQLRHPKFAGLIDEAIKEVIGDSVTLTFVLSQTPEKAELVEVSPMNNLTQVATEVLM